MIEANTGDYKVKSVDFEYHKIQDYMKKYEFGLVYCPSEEMLADILNQAPWTYAILEATAAIQYRASAYNVAVASSSNTRHQTSETTKWECGEVEDVMSLFIDVVYLVEDVASQIVVWLNMIMGRTGTVGLNAPLRLV